MTDIDWSKAPEDPKKDLMLMVGSITEYRKDGFLVWTNQVGKKDLAGMVAGSVSPSDGYRYVKCRGRRVAAHRVIFLIHHGYCPPEVDHINRIRDDNRIENLRDPGSHTNNLGNQSHQKDRSSQYKGVCWDKSRGKWLAMIKYHGKKTFLGRFSCELEAAYAYNVAALEKFGKFANINVMAGYRKQAAP